MLALPTLAKDPPRNSTRDELAAFRSGCIHLLCLAGLGGYPQLAFPASSHGMQFSLSLLGARNADRMMLNTASHMRRL